MGYLDSKGLQHAAWVTKNQTAQNWQMTKSKGAVTFCPAPQSELEPIVDFMFTETPPVEGEKGPDNPSTIAGISSVRLRRCGKNLLLHPYQYSSQTINGVEFTVNVDGSITINGTENGTGNIVFWINSTIEKEYIHPNIQYCLSGPKASDSGGVRLSLDLYDSKQGTYLKTISACGGSSSNQPNVVSWTEDKLYRARSYIFVYKNTTCNNITFYPQLEIGSSRTDYELGNNHIMDFSLNGTYYGGSLNVKTGELTVTHTCISFDGTETWDLISGYNSTTGLGYTRGYPVAKDPNHRRAYEWFKEFSIGNASINDGLYSCSHFPIIGMFGPTAIENSTITKPCMWYTGTNGDHTLNGQCRFAVPFSDISDFKAWLAQQNTAGTPLTVVYRINEPYTVQLTPQQILSLPQEDKYVPRINIVYTDQKSVRVGYRRLDCIELRSDQIVHGEKTFTDSPLVPNPDDLDSQQAAPISFVKDMLRAEVEAMSGGKNTIIRDQWNNPHVMVRIPKFLLKDIDSSWPNEPHPAFIVNGVQKSEIFIGKYLASQSSSGKVQTLPRQTPWTLIDFDNALTACRALGNGFCLNTNASWAARALWLYKTLGGEHEYIGNNNCGRNHLYHELTGTMKNNSYIPGNTSISDAATLTGSGGIKWIDDETPYGIDDFVGNVWERVAGFRINNGEIQIIPNNDATLSTCNMSISSTEWKAVLQDGSIVVPGTANTLKFDSQYPDKTTWENAGSPIINTSITNIIGAGYNGVYFKNLEVLSGISIPTILKQLAIFPINNNLQGYMWVRNYGETIPLRGGCWLYADWCGPFAITLTNVRNYSRNIHGFRLAYVA